MRNSKGFSEFEFLGLIAAGLVIAGLLAHFIIDQSIQVERLRALVHRDAVRLNLESRLLDVEVMKKSASLLEDNTENAILRACILGDEGNKSCAKKSECCVARTKRSMAIYQLGDDRKMIAGSSSAPACLNEEGEPFNGPDCFAMARVSLEPVCASGALACRQASAVLLRYQVQFLPAFLKNEPELSVLERTISLVLEKRTTAPSP